MIADLSGKTAIITGGGQGLGLGISTKIAGQGANIIVTDLDDRNKSTVEELAKTNNVDLDRKSTRLNSSHSQQSRMPSSA